MSKFTLITATVWMALLSAWSTPAHAQSRVLDPLDDWNWGRTAEYCGLVRNFGDAEDPVRLVIHSYGTSGSYRILLTGANLPQNTRAATEGSAAFGGLEDMQNIHMIVSKSGDGGAIEFVAKPREALIFVFNWSGGRDNFASVDIDPQATQLTFDVPDMEPITLALGSMENSLSDLRQCEEQLVASWALDVADRDTVDAPASIDNAYEVARLIRRPDAMVINRASQIMQIRLTIEEDGTATDCVLQSPGWRDRDVRGVCRAFTDIGNYTPAKNAAGQAIASILHTTYLLLIYD
ncbi:MAG: hypothetical protein WA957_02675 [Alteraurantiacibacter sp.]